MVIGLLWHSFSSGNLGVGALSIANLKIIDDVCSGLNIKAEYILFGSKGEHNYAPSNSDLRHRYVEFSENSLKQRPGKLFSELKKCDIFFDIGEGDSFSDIYGFKRLAKLLISKAMVTILRKPLILSPQTIGPFKNPVYLAASKFIMQKCNRVIARDHESAKLIHALKLKNVGEAIDVAFKLPYTKLGCSSNQITKVGLNISALLFHGGYNGKNQFSLKSDYADLTRKLVKALLSNKNLEVHLIPHVTPNDFPEEDDYKSSLIIKHEFPNVVLSPRFSDPIEAKSYISGLDFFIGARMHATIAAFSSHVPVIPLAYSRKFTGLYESINYRRVIDLRTVDSEQCVSSILKAIEERHNISSEIKNSETEIENRIQAYKNIIAEELTRTNEKKR